VAEGLSASEVGQEIAHHLKQSRAHGEATGYDRVVTIVEAALLAAVALLAAWSGYASAKWSTESRLLLAEASTARAQANRAALEADELVNFDAATFDSWFTAFAVGNEPAMEVAERRFRPEFAVAFDAWTATDPVNNPAAPPGPSYMPEYERPGVERARELDARAEESFAEGAEAAANADRYVRFTVFLATVLFLVGISGHFRVRGARVGLVVIGTAIFVLAALQLAAAPLPPG
jgi:hypothetical protein